MYVAIDTSVLPNGWKVQSQAVRTLIAFLRGRQSRLLLSDIVRIEAAATYERECKAALDKLENALNKGTRLFMRLTELDKAAEFAF